MPTQPLFRENNGIYPAQSRLALVVVAVLALTLLWYVLLWRAPVAFGWAVCLTMTVVTVGINVAHLLATFGPGLELEIDYNGIRVRYRREVERFIPLHEIEEVKVRSRVRRHDAEHSLDPLFDEELFFAQYLHKCLRIRTRSGKTYFIGVHDSDGALAAIQAGRAA